MKIDEERNHSAKIRFLNVFSEIIYERIDFFLKRVVSRINK
jgi:hypothetical protein